MWIRKDGFEELETDHGLIYLEPRPYYCDRGRCIVKVFPKHGFNCTPCAIDEQDGFPRYYFDVERAKAEVAEWMRARKWQPVMRGGDHAEPPRE
jgi:hypothetical protein